MSKRAGMPSEGCRSPLHLTACTTINNHLNTELHACLLLQQLSHEASSIISVEIESTWVLIF